MLERGTVSVQFKQGPPGRGYKNVVANSLHFRLCWGSGAVDLMNAIELLHLDPWDSHCWALVAGKKAVSHRDC
jgi:hypothetical protein